MERDLIDGLKIAAAIFFVFLVVQGVLGFFGFWTPQQVQVNSTQTVTQSSGGVNITINNR